MPIHGPVLIDHVDADEDHHQRCPQNQERADRCRNRTKLGLGCGVEIGLGGFNEVGDDTHRGAALPIACGVADGLGGSSGGVGAAVVGVRGLQHLPSFVARVALPKHRLGSVPGREPDFAVAAAGLDDPLEILGAVDVLDQHALIGLARAGFPASRRARRAGPDRRQSCDRGLALGRARQRRRRASDLGPARPR